MNVNSIFNQIKIIIDNKKLITRQYMMPSSFYIRRIYNLIKELHWICASFNNNFRDNYLYGIVTPPILVGDMLFKALIENREKEYLKKLLDSGYTIPTGVYKYILLNKDLDGGKKSKELLFDRELIDDQIVKNPKFVSEIYNVLPKELQKKYAYLKMADEFDMLESINTNPIFSKNPDKSQIKKIMKEALSSNFDEFIDSIVTSGIDVNIKNDDGNTILLFTLIRHDCNLEKIKKLIDLGADVNLCNDIGCSPLFMACRIYHNYETVKLLIDRGADINHETLNTKNTPLLAASNLNFVDTVELLLDKGADYEHKNSKGEDFWDVAKSDVRDLIKKRLPIFNAAKEFDMI